MNEATKLVKILNSKNITLINHFEHMKPVKTTFLPFTEFFFCYL